LKLISRSTGDEISYNDRNHEQFLSVRLGLAMSPGVDEACDAKPVELAHHVTGGRTPVRSAGGAVAGVVGK
jgi:hypothetical protein